MIFSGLGKGYKEFKFFNLNDHFVCFYSGDGRKCRAIVINVKREDIESCSASSIDVEELDFNHFTIHQLNNKTFIVANKGMLQIYIYLYTSDGSFECI